jgi:HK97 family phage prohead protease
MPIPKPNTNESRQDFITRCMGDDTMASEYTDSDQRLAVCTSEYDSNKEDSTQNDEKHIRAVEETDDSYIIEFGKSKPDSEETVDEMASKEEAEKESLEIKSSIKAYHDDEEDKNYGTFEGYGSVFGNKDLGNDVIERGAFLKSLKRRKPQNVKLLYQHKSDMPIGVFDEIREDDHGLVVKGRLALKTQAGAEAYELLKMGALDGLSIGFRVNPKEVSYDKRGNKRIIKEVDLMEVSLVTFPMNPQATVRSVKGEDISIREWENGMRDAFSLSRSEAKMAAKAVTDAFGQRDVDTNAELVDAIKNLTLTLKS